MTEYFKSSKTRRRVCRPQKFNKTKASKTVRVKS